MPTYEAQPQSFDVIIVGGGACGALAAHQLTASGLEVLLLEAGPREPSADAPPGEQPVQSQCWAHTAGSRRLFVDDALHPYVTPPDRPFLWIRGRQLGGKTHLWSYGAPRWQRDELEGFDRVDDEGAWPFTYDDLAPHYDAVEAIYGVVGAAAASGETTSVRGRAARRMTGAELAFKRDVEQRWPDRRVVLLPHANPFGPDEPEDFERMGAYLRDPSNGPLWGCCTRSILPTALASGRLTIATDSIVRSLIVDPETDRVLGAQVVDRTSRRVSQRFARSVVLCASTLESTRILLNSRSARWPDGLANSSGSLGRYLTDHVWGVGIRAVSERPVANRHLDVYPPLLIPPFRTTGGEALERFQLICYLQARDDGGTLLRIEAQGEASSRRDNRVTIADSVVDQWNIPALRIAYQRSDHDRALERAALRVAEEIARAAGFRTVERDEKAMAPGISVHEAGTARMGLSRHSSVLNGFGQSWDIPNLFVTDGAVFPRAGVRNPMITLLAITHRACGHLERFLRGTAGAHAS